MNDIEHHDGKELERLLTEEETSDRKRLIEVWDTAGEQDSVPFPDPERIQKIWGLLEAETLRPGAYRPPLRRVGTRRVFGRMAIAVAATVAIVVIGLKVLTRTHTYQAPVDALEIVTLPDGSQIELNNGSVLSYRRTLSGDRFTTLEGEAFFDVVHNEQRFEVLTFNGRVEVLGTRFNVRAWKNGFENATLVTLESGSVRMAHRNHPRAAVLLAPGDSRLILADRAQPSSTDPTAATSATAWRNGDLIFRDVLLAVALEDVERRFNIVIGLSNPELGERRVNVAFRSPDDPESVVNDLAMAFGVKYRRTSTGFEMYQSE